MVFICIRRFVEDCCIPKIQLFSIPLDELPQSSHITSARQEIVSPVYLLSVGLAAFVKRKSASAKFLLLKASPFK